MVAVSERLVAPTSVDENGEIEWADRCVCGVGGSSCLVWMCFDLWWFGVGLMLGLTLFCC